MEEKALKKSKHSRGRPSEMTSGCLQEIKARVDNGEAKANVARALGISRDTLYRYLKQDSLKLKNNNSQVKDPIDMVKKYAHFFWRGVERDGGFRLDFDDTVSIVSEVFAKCQNKYVANSGASFETYFRKAVENRMKNEIRKLIVERKTIGYYLPSNQEESGNLERRL